MSDYLNEITDVVQQKDEGKTDLLCSRNAYTYQNGIHYSFTDLGPCESCRHSVTEITLPRWTLHQAFVFITNFDSELWNINGVPIENYMEHISPIEGNECFPAQFQWEYIYDSVTWGETENGIKVCIDTIL